MPPGGLLASEGAPSPAAGAGGWLPRGSVSAGQGAAAVWTGTGWPAAWGDASSLGCSVTGGWGGPGGDRSHQGEMLSAEGAAAAGMGETGCPDGVAAGGTGRSRCGVLLSEGGVTAGGQMGCLEGVTVAGTGETVFSEGVMAGGTGETGCPEGTMAGEMGRSCCGGVRSPCRASPGEGGGEVGGNTLSPIGDGGFPATQAEQNRQSLSAGARGSPIPPKTQPSGGAAPYPPITALGSKAAPGHRGWGQSPGAPREKAAGHPPEPCRCSHLGERLRHPMPGARRRVHNAQREPAGAPPGTAATKPPFFPGQLPPRPRCGGTRGQRPHTGTGTHTLPRRSSRRMRGRFRRCSRHGRRQDGRGPRGLTSPLRPYVPQHRAMLWPGLSTAMNSWPRNVHEAAAAAAATSKQLPPRVAPGHSLPRHGMDGGHGACSGHPKGSSPRNRPPCPGRPQGSPAAGGPRCTSRHWGQRRGASHPAKPQHVPSAQGGCARTACGDQQRSSPPSQLTSPLQMHLWGTCPGPQPRPPRSGQRRRSCPGTMPDLPWCHGHPAPAPVHDPSSGSTAWWGHQ